VAKLEEGLLACALWAMICRIAWNVFTRLVRPGRCPEP
jgi:TRAP-type C4-dicarboxylate transport system permease small subunit